MTKSEFKEQMVLKRKMLFSKANEQLNKVIHDPKLYLRYLELQATLGYTVTNTLMVMYVNPNVSCLKDYARWKDLGSYPKKNEKGIQILEPTGKEYRRKDGSIGATYNIKYVFDVSQTNYNGELNLKLYPSKQNLLDALSYKCDINPIIVKGEYDYPRSVFYSARDRCIYLYQHLGIDDMITGLMREYAFIEFREPNSFVIYSVVYMMCYRYGISRYDSSFIKDMHQFFMSKGEKKSKSDLEEIKRVFTILVKRVNSGLYAKENKNYGTSL